MRRILPGRSEFGFGQNWKRGGNHFEKKPVFYACFHDIFGTIYLFILPMTRKINTIL